MYKSIRAAASKSAIDIVAVCAGGSLPPTRTGLGKTVLEQLDRAKARPSFRGDPGEVADAGAALLLGLGKGRDLEPDVLRMAGARLVRQLDRREIGAARLDLRGIDDRRLKPSAAGRAIAEGMALANWRVDFFDGSATKNEPPRRRLSVDAVGRETRRGVERGLLLAEATNFARRLAATPPNICHPQSLAAEARRLAKATGLRCRIIDAKQAESLGMGGLVNVGRASTRKPCLIVLEHRPTTQRAAGKTNPHLVLVGKTITYDTGGYSLKISNSMKGMKYDKCGGMAVLGAMQAIATLELPVRVTGVLPTAENMVSGDAYRPDDIVTMFNGVAVEVTNTDAEGRLVLADALAWGCKTLKPSAIVDVATLTGGVITALGSWCAGLFCNDDGLRRRLQAAADRSGERLWRLPLWDDHRDFMRSKHADIWNSGPKRDGHPIQGAAFLSYFVDEKIPWAHLDIAGMASVDGDGDLYVQGPTGYGVRLLTELAEGFAES